MWDELTNVTINHWCGLEDTLRTREQVAPVFNGESKYENESGNKNSGEDRPDNRGGFPLRFRSFVVQVVAGGGPGAQERALLASRLCTLFCVTGSHGIS